MEDVSRGFDGEGVFPWQFGRGEGGWGEGVLTYFPDEFVTRSVTKSRYG